MNDLPFEIIEYIAKLDNEIWYKLVQVFKFLSNKNSTEDMKRKFLLCSSNTGFEPNSSVKFKYIKKDGYALIYYLPNGNLHTFEDPCIAYDPISDIHINIWFKDNLIHRDNDPAIISMNDKCFSDYHGYKFLMLKYLNISFFYASTKVWLKNGNFYRDDDLPVIVQGEFDEIKEWRKNGLRHSDNDLPAFITDNVRCWYQNDLLHRDNDLPAVIYKNGRKEFYKNGYKYIF
jgi:hypothetical protein